MTHTLKISSWLLRSFLSRHAAIKGGFSSSGFTTRVGFNFIQSRNSTTSAPPVEYEFIEGVEDISQYRLGRYHPVHIDDRLNKRYRVVNKLGYGSFSTVWLALDEKTTKYVAIKVGTTDANRREIDIISQIAQSPVMDKSAPDQKLLFPTVLDRFEIIGPNGIHPCLVTPPARCSLRDSQDNGRFGYFQLDVARSLAAQLVIAPCQSSTKEVLPTELYALYGEPDKEPLVCLDTKAASTHPSVPSYAVHSAWFGILSDHIQLGEANLVLSDFGVAFRPDEKSQFVSHALAAVMRPPELQFEPEVSLTFASDIWSLGYAIFEFLAHRTILDEYYIMYETNIIAQHIGLKGLYFDKEANSENTVVDYDTVYLVMGTTISGIGARLATEMGSGQIC
ncbi:hypothetical protein E4U60_005546 [Claviceps pazoutovae]|uniref:non-specific serine/threonine protein kinase n=1 Tax=Claviceps pazoutovae TaxID=1649127 RepID=A0A9P7M7M0_9HYPO|nr:hypothetical protein E4U60_005546 [Claviceps pazoutovae]